MIPKRLRLRLRYLRDALLDAADVALRRRPPGLPPRRLRFVGAGDFRAIGEEMVRLLIEVGGLQRSDRVLDIGCGVGRVAMPLTRYLDGSQCGAAAPGEISGGARRGGGEGGGATLSCYEGFDIVPAAIRWCQRNITHPGFRFTHVNVRNTFYRPRGMRGTELRFPYDDTSFDFAFATSVFTHLDLETSRHYLRETHRVVRPGGRLLATFFLLDDDVKSRLGRGAALRFEHVRDGYRLDDASDPDAAIAIEEPLLRDLLPPSQWRIETVERGFWSGSGVGKSFQDVVVATRLAP